MDSGLARVRIRGLGVTESGALGLGFCVRVGTRILPFGGLVLAEWRGFSGD
jgi:hypothetical protein